MLSQKKIIQTQFGQGTEELKRGIREIPLMESSGIH